MLFFFLFLVVAWGCVNDTECSAGLHCNASYVCAFPLQAGSPCESSLWCQSRVCLGNKCSCETADSFVNNSCPNDAPYCCPHGDPSCWEQSLGNTCQTCRTDSSGGGPCPVDHFCIGSACLEKHLIGALCSASYQCRSGACNQRCIVCNVTGCPAAEPFCLGSQCRPCLYPDQGVCWSHQFCSSANYCMNKGSLGINCARDVECASDKCFGALCRCNSDRNATGCPSEGPCVAMQCVDCLYPQGPCPAGQHCNASNQCQNDLPQGSACNQSSECISGNCVANRCTCIENTAIDNGCNSTRPYCAQGSCWPCVSRSQGLCNWTMQFCQGNECHNKLYSNELCTSSDECINDNCVSQSTTTAARCVCIPQPTWSTASSYVNGCSPLQPHCWNFTCFQCEDNATGACNWATEFCNAALECELLPTSLTLSPSMGPTSETASSTGESEIAISPTSQGPSAISPASQTPSAMSPTSPASEIASTISEVVSPTVTSESSLATAISVVPGTSMDPPSPSSFDQQSRAGRLCAL